MARLREVGHVPALTPIFKCAVSVPYGAMVVTRRFPGARCWIGVLGTLLFDGGMAGNAVTLRVTDAEGRPVPDAVVYYEARSLPPPDPVARAIVDQVDAAFVPEITVIRTGTVVEFPNSDDVSHHVYSFARPNSFELPLYRGEVTPTVRFDHAGIVVLGCNIHDSMLGYIVVVDTPYFDVTDERGIASLISVPQDAAAFFVWSPRLDPGQALQIDMDGVDREAQPLAINAGRRLRTLPKSGSGALAWDEY